MGLFGSKESTDEGRQHSLVHGNEHTTGGDCDASSADSTEFWTDWQEETPEDPWDCDESGDNQELESHSLGHFHNPYSDFREQIETLFSRAEEAICGDGFHLEFAQEWVLCLRDVGQRYVDRGCEESRLEEMVMTRALTTVDELVDGVQTRKEEVYDPRQTMTYIYCALAVFPSTVCLLGGREGGLTHELSTGGSMAVSSLEVLNEYCATKTKFEKRQGWTNTVSHFRLVLTLAEWLEAERAPATFLICSKLLPVLAALARRFVGLPQLLDPFRGLGLMGLVLAASALAREDLLQQAGDYHRALNAVNTDTLPPSLASRRLYVQARLLHSCGQWGPALECARKAQRAGTDSLEMRGEIQALVTELMTHVQSSPDDTRNVSECAGTAWLEGTGAVENQAREHLQDTLRRRHHARMERRSKKTKTKAVSRRGQTPSAPAPCNSQRHAVTGGSSTDTPGPSMFTLNTSGHGPHGDSSDSRPRPVLSVSPSRQTLPHYVDLDDSDDEEIEEWEERDIRFVDSSDEDDQREAQGGSVDNRPTMVTVDKIDDDADSAQSWFEKSEDFIANRGVDDEDEDVIQLSEGQTSAFRKEGQGREFYPRLHHDPHQLLQQNPRIYKRCQLKIERSHKAVAKVLDKDCDYSDILIEGRSKAGRTYMDDEVVVEILAEPGRASGARQVKGAGSASGEDRSEKAAHGKVVGIINRPHLADVEHPVFFCTLDEIEGHLMKPLCKTVPKIHVMHDNVKKKFKDQVKNRIEIKKISPKGQIQFRGYCDVQPEKREQYVFRVVFLAWRQCSIYPLGAVLDAHIGGKDYSGGLQVLSMQQRVPKFYSRSAVEDTKRMAQDTHVSRAARDDLTDERLFTIDPPGSKDLDDAISLRTKGGHRVIGVHIADVAAVVKKDSGVDQEARRRAVTFYPLNRPPRCMLPEPLSHGKCSLLPGEERLALSVFFTFDHNAQQVAEPEIRRTVIKSRQQLTYEQAQRVIEGQVEVNVEPLIQEDIRQIHQITSKLRAARQGDAMLFVPFEDPRLPELETINDCVAAHALIEELMILTNSHVAGYLIKRPRYRDGLIVRCQRAPTFEERVQWQEKEGHVTNLVMQLQGKRITPGSQLRLKNRPRSNGYPPLPPVVVQRQVWQKLCAHLEDGEIAEARRLAFMDAVHPLQCLATNSWMDLMATAEYRCAHGLNSPDLRHFGLDLAVYTHFTSPIRRYADLHVQRLLHAALDGTPSVCGPDDVTELCQHVNGATSRQKAFDKGCLALRVAEQLQHQPLVFRSFVDTVDDDQLAVFVPSLRTLQDRKQEVPFSVLGVSSQPEVVTDTVLKTDSVTVRWKRRFYDERGTCPATLRSVWQHLNQSGHACPSKHVVLTIRPDLLSETVRQTDWIDILQVLTAEGQWPGNTAPQAIHREMSEVEDMSSEKGDGTGFQTPVHFQRVYTRGQIVQLQMSAEPKRGIIKPRVEILHTARNACVCTQHVSKPVQTLTRVATRSTRGKDFSSYKQYVKAWMPLLEMEAAVDAGDCDGSVVIANVSVTIKPQTSSSNVLYKGSFTLPAEFCYTRCIEFGGKSVDSIRREEYKSDNSFPLDYLCLRYKTDCSPALVSLITQGKANDLVDRHYTWLAHGSVVQVLHTNRRAGGGGQVTVIFDLSPSSPKPPDQLMKERGARVTLEILPKTEVDRRCQEMLLQLENPKCHLAQAIAFGTSVPTLDSEHRRLGKRDANHEVYLKEGVALKVLPKNNNAQLAAIKLALTNSLAIVQGPPGTGKTNTGIKLVYLFCKINRQLQADGEGRKTVLYCGPSNKSVDLVARELNSKLGTECPKMVRMYGSAIERKDYPVPVEDVRSTRGMRDLNSDPKLQNVALHHLIREEGKPYAQRIAVFENHFEKCRTQPALYSVTDKELKRYRRLLFKASVEELKHYEVVLCTCAVAGNRKLIKGSAGSIYQLIIDECAMSPEPQSMVPIVATGPKQVVLIGDHKQLRPIIKCQAAADLGLDQSLFERLFQRFRRNTTFHDTQYRMHPEICAFPAREFYQNQLKTAFSHLWARGLILKFWPKDPHGTDTQVPHLLVDVHGDEETLTVSTDEGNERSKSNRKEADKVIEILTFLRKQGVDLQSVKLLTLYNAQRHLLESQLKMAIQENEEHVFDHYDSGKVNVSTVVSSQGGEWDYVVLSTVRSLPSHKIEPNPTHGWCRQNMGFITDSNQVNVALTRARKGLFIVGNVELLYCDELWRRLIDRYREMGCFIPDPDSFPPKNARRRVRKRAQGHAVPNEPQASQRLP